MHIHPNSASLDTGCNASDHSINYTEYATLCPIPPKKPTSDLWKTAHEVLPDIRKQGASDAELRSKLLALLQPTPHEYASVEDYRHQLTNVLHSAYITQKSKEEKYELSLRRYRRRLIKVLYAVQKSREQALHTSPSNRI